MPEFLVFLSTGMLIQPNDMALIQAMQQLTPVRVTDHLAALLPLCAKFNIDLSEEDFKKQFAEILSIDAENMEEFDSAWNAHIDLNSPTLKQNLEALTAYKIDHPDTSFVFYSNTNPIHLKYIQQNLTECLNKLSVDANSGISTTFSAQQKPVDLLDSLFKKLPPDASATILLPDHSSVKLEKRRVQLNEQNAAIAVVADKYNVRAIELEGKLAEVNLDRLLNSNKPKP
jgi:hypothetical protein